MTLHLRVSPEELSTLAAGSASEAGVTGTVTADLWAQSKHTQQQITREFGHLSISPQVKLCQVSTPTNSSSHLVARGPVRVVGVTVAGLAPCAACNVPGVGCAAVTVLTNHVAQAVALAAAALAVAVAWRRAAGGLATQTVADALWREKKKRGAGGRFSQSVIQFGSFVSPPWL